MQKMTRKAIYSCHFMSDPFPSSKADYFIAFNYFMHWICTKIIVCTLWWMYLEWSSTNNVNIQRPNKGKQTLKVCSMYLYNLTSVPGTPGDWESTGVDISKWNPFMELVKHWSSVWCFVTFISKHPDTQLDVDEESVFNTEKRRHAAQLQI